MGNRVLVVEDQDDQRKAIAALLASEGYEIAEARDGDEGLTRAVEWGPDLIVVDFLMPRMDGEQMARAIQDGRSLPPIPLIAITSLNLDARRKRELSDLFRVFLRKPINLREFLDEVWAATHVGSRGE